MHKINRILIANRGEITSRIIRTCQDMDIETVAIFSDADKKSVYLKKADIAVYIGGSKPEESYLNIEKIIQVALKTNCDAIHPGYGFLSENYQFAQKCLENNLIFIGPEYETIRLMGSKISARELMIENNIPVIPGLHFNKSTSFQEITEKVEQICFPVLIKASAGGGGKGMKIVHQLSELEDALESARREANNSFGDDSIFIEKYFPAAHHIEFQILGDNHGNFIHLFERECSIQRRYQKIIEETPSPFLNKQTREQMIQTSLKIAAILKYNNAGTIEFLVDENNNYYFMEINTRLQVEHGITEAVTGLDLVKLQIEIAEGKILKLKQEDINISSHAIEVRLYAEDPVNNFSPATGQVILYQEPETKDIRIDTDLNSGTFISSYYDPMLAKVIAKSQTREKAIKKIKKALSNLIISGISTNREFLLNILLNNSFSNGEYDNSFVEKNYSELVENTAVKEHFPLFLISGFLNNWLKRKKQNNKLQNIPSGWRNTFYQYQKDFFSENYSHTDSKFHEVNYRYLENNSFEVIISEEVFKVEILEHNSEKLSCIINEFLYKFTISSNNNKLFIHSSQLGSCVLNLESRFPDTTKKINKGEYKSPLPGEIAKINVKAGDNVKEGDSLLIIISMKMENTIYAHSSGIVEEVFVNEKSFIEADKPLLKITAIT